MLWLLVSSLVKSFLTPFFALCSLLHFSWLLVLPPNSFFLFSPLTASPPLHFWFPYSLLSPPLLLFPLPLLFAFLPLLFFTVPSFLFPSSHSFSLPHLLYLPHFLFYLFLVPLSQLHLFFANVLICFPPPHHFPYVLSLLLQVSIFRTTFSPIPFPPFTFSFFFSLIPLYLQSVLISSPLLLPPAFVFLLSSSTITEGDGLSICVISAD